MKSSTMAGLVACVLALALTTPAVAQDGAWAASGGLLLNGDPDEPLTGDGGFEFAVWRVLSEKWDVGARVSMLEFQSEGLSFAEPPSIPVASADITTVELLARWYPLGSDSTLFPWASFGAVAVVSDNFDSATRFVGDPGLGIVESADWDVDGVGIAFEGGVRWDFSGGRWFLDAGARYLLLGAVTTASVTVEGAPSEAQASREITTDLDSFVASVSVGIYF